MSVEIFPNHKACVFCGSKPNDKNKEHVIPKWMIKMTGDTKRPFNWGSYASKQLEVKSHIPFDQFTFPACEACNNEFAKLEDFIKTVFDKLLAFENLTLIEIDRLLDWFDKIRTGLWLGTRYLNKDIFKDPPNFHIKKRTALNDRFLAIYWRDEKVFRCSGLGVAKLPFIYMPSAAGFVFNQLAFVTVSTDYLLAKNMGWPFPKSMKLMHDGMLSVDMIHGTERIKNPIYTFPLTENCTQIFQPMVRGDLPAETIQSLYDNEFVKRQCINFESGRGIPRIYTSMNREIYPDEDGCVNVLPKGSGLKGEEFVSRVAISVLKIQNLLWSQTRGRCVDQSGEKNMARLRNTFLKMNNEDITSYLSRIEAERNFRKILFREVD